MSIPPGLSGMDPKGIIWKTKDGLTIPVLAMAPSHLFFTLNMLYTHLVLAHGGQPVWDIKRHSGYITIARQNPLEMARLVLFFIEVLGEGGDLQPNLQAPYDQIRANVEALDLPPVVRRAFETLFAPAIRQQVREVRKEKRQEREQAMFLTRLLGLYGERE